MSSSSSTERPPLPNLEPSLSQALSHQKTLALHASQTTQKLIRSTCPSLAPAATTHVFSSFQTTLASLYATKERHDERRITIRKKAQQILAKIIEDNSWLATSMQHTLTLQMTRGENCEALRDLLERLAEGEAQRIECETKLQALQKPFGSEIPQSSQKDQGETLRQKIEALRNSARKREIQRDELRSFEVGFLKRAAELQSKRQESFRFILSVKDARKENIEDVENLLKAKIQRLQEITSDLSIKESAPSEALRMEADSLTVEIKMLQESVSQAQRLIEEQRTLEDASKLYLKIWDWMPQLHEEIALMEKAIFQLEMKIFDAEVALQQLPSHSNEGLESQDEFLAIQGTLAEVKGNLGRIFSDKEALLKSTFQIDHNLDQVLEIQARVSEEVARLTSELQKCHSELTMEVEECEQIDVRVEEVMENEGKWLTKQQQEIIESPLKRASIESIPMELKEQLANEIREWKKFEILKRLHRDWIKGRGAFEKEKTENQEALECLLHQHLIKIVEESGR